MPELNVTSNQTKEKVVKVGSTVTYKDPFGKIHTYTIVPDHEMNLPQRKISASSPLAKAVLGKSAGISANVKAPAGEYQIEILKLI